MKSITWVFFLGDLLMTGRLLLIGVLAVYDRVRSPAIGTPAQIAAFKPKVAILIPAYNEEKVIERTVRSALDSDYPNLHVIVIDDGSKDRTLEVARHAFAQEEADGRVLILTKPNAGKAEALNYGLEHLTDEEIFVGIDADTVIAPDAVSHAGPALPESEGGRHRRERESRQPGQSLDALAGSRIHHQPEFRAARARYHGRRERRAGSDRRVARCRRARGRRLSTSIP